LTRKIVQMSFLVTVASILFSIETLIQSPIPGVRLGLANIATILSLKWWGIKEALIILLMRVLIGSFLTGRFLQPVFLFSLSGGLVAAVVMGLVMVYGNRVFSLIGISILGALFHNLTQILVAYFLYVRQVEIFFLLPLFIFSSLVTGILIGFLAYLVCEKIVIDSSIQITNSIQ